MTAEPVRIDEQLMRRIRAEFTEMPGTQLTMKQAQRLWALDEATCRQALNTLVEARFLRPIEPDRFMRVRDGPDVSSRSRMAKADLNRHSAIANKEVV